jgi:putative DNA-invertase from lambdoid prophage Rac
MTLDEIVVEEGVSGFMPVSERVKGGALFVKLKAGDVVIAPKFDCLFRSLLDALRVVEDLKKRGVSLHLLDLGGDISGNGLSKLFQTIAAAFAEAERDRIRERIGQVKADQKARGRYLGGGRPFGFQLGADGDLVPHEDEQKAISQMRRLQAKGTSLRAISQAMQAKGFSINHDGVARVLRAAEI